MFSLRLISDAELKSVAVIIPEEYILPTVRIPNVVIPDTLSCWEVKLVVLVTTNVVIPETFNCCYVKLVADVTPRVVIPDTFNWAIDASPLNADAVIIPDTNRSPATVNFDVASVVPIPKFPLDGI